MELESMCFLLYIHNYDKKPIKKLLHMYAQLLYAQQVYTAIWLAPILPELPIPCPHLPFCV